MARCEVKVCAATKCKHNKNLNCQLDTIMVRKDGMCGDYEIKEWKATFKR